MNTYEKIISILQTNNIKYDEISHWTSSSCEQSKQFRDEQWLIGLWSKNIIFHCKWNFYLVTTHGDKQIKARNFKKEFGSKDIRFASQDEISSLMDATIWSIPPFGFENKTLPIFVDLEIFENEYFIFNPSDPTKSIRVTTNDLQKIYKSLPNPIKGFTHTEELFEIKNI